MNKRYIDKDLILLHLNNKDITGLVRQMKIDMLLRTDIVMLDRWSSKFYSDLNIDERKMRDNLRTKYMFDSSSLFLKDDDYKHLNSLSEALLSLINDPMWVDIHIVIEKLSLNVSDDEAGSFQILRQKCIDAIIKHFD